MNFCNNSSVDKVDGKININGSPNEVAVKVLGEKLKRTGKKNFFVDLEGKSFRKLVTFKFNSARKMNSVICETNGDNIMYSYGVAEKMIKCSSYYLSDSGPKVLAGKIKDKILNECTHLNSEGVRCFIISYKTDLGEFSNYDGPGHPSHSLLESSENLEKIESELIFLGVVAIRNPLRPEVTDLIQTLKQSGLKLILLSGEVQGASESIAKQVGIMDSQTLSLQGSEVQEMDDEKLKNKLALSHSVVISRATPGQKHRLVSLIKELSEIVIMSGLGTNDAPALKTADISIAMGIISTKLAKDASDIILLDDNFASVLALIEEGRSFYSNLIAFIRFLISLNIGEVLAILLASLLGLPDIFTSIQILWINLLTDGAPATALGFSPPDLDLLKTLPRKKNDSLITKALFFRCFIIGLYIALATIGIFVYWYLFFDSADGHPLVSYSQLSNWSECSEWTGFKLSNWGGLDLEKNPCSYFTEGKVKAATLSLSVLILLQMFNALNAISLNNSVFKVPVWVNPWLIVSIASSIILHLGSLYIPFFNRAFGTLPLDFEDWILVLCFSIPVIAIDEVFKVVNRRIVESRKLIEKKNN